MKSVHCFITWICLLSLPAMVSAGLNDEIDQIFSEYDSTDGPGCAMGVYQEGQMVFSKGYGMASLELGVPNSPQSVYYIASTSKQFTAAAIALASLEGKLSMNDPISMYFPELPEYAKAIQVRHLVHHSSGLRDYLGLMGMGGWPFENVYSNQWVLELIARQQNTNFTPGDQYSYSNSGYFLMSELIRRVSGKSLREYTHEKIFQPLGMIHTHFHDDRLEIDGNRAMAYAPAENGGYQLNWLTNFDKVGSGGLYTTVEDLLLWERNFIDDQLGGGMLIRTMLEPGVFNSGEVQDYAYGLSLDEHRGLKTVGHGGAFMGFRAQFTRFPDLALGVSVLCNVASASPGQLALQVADLYLKDLPTQDPKSENGESESNRAIARSLRNKLQGHYREIRTGLHLPVFTQADGLALTFMGGDFPLIHEVENSFRLQGLPFDVRLDFSADGQTVELTVGGSPFGRFERSYLAETGSDTLAEFSGRYYSAELDSNYDISVTENELMMRPGKSDATVLKSTFPDTFENSSGGTVLEFQRNASGAVNGIVLNGFRVLGIEMVRLDN